MKKALAMALGAVLVAGSAAPAFAATAVDFTGYYRAFYAVNGNLGYTGDNNLNESFFEHRLNIDVTFQATDEVSVVWRFRAPAGQRWGTGFGQFSTHYIYGQVVQDWGTVRVGRLSGGAANEFGLSTLGWAPVLDDVFTYIAPFESAGDADGIQYSNTWDNGFGLSASYVKVTDGFPGGGWTEADGSDHDADRYQVQGTYQWDGGGVALNTYYLRDASENPRADRTDPDYEPGAADVTSAWYINPALMHSWGAFSFHFEGMFAFGETSYTDLKNGDSVNDQDADGQGFYLDFDYNYGPGRVNLAGWWVSGNDVTDDGNDNDNNALVDIVNGNFMPLVVAYAPANGNAYLEGPSTYGDRGGATGAVGVANAGDTFISNKTILSDGVAGFARGDALPVGFNDSRFNDSRRSNTSDVNDQANHWALMLSGQHAFTDEITFNYALAYMALNNPNYEVLDRGSFDSGTGDYSARYVTQDKDLGWEIDLGVNVQLLDNLAFTSTVGYMFTGDAYKQLQGYTATDLGNGDYSVRAEWEDADDAYSWLNSLTFSF